MNVIKHKGTDFKVLPDDVVTTPDGLQAVDFTVYGWMGAAVWTRPTVGPSKRWMASEVGCYVTSED